MGRAPARLKESPGRGIESSLNQRKEKVPGKKALSLVLEKYAMWLETKWRQIIGLLLWAVIALIILFIGSLRLSDRIQAVSVVTLVFITWFYAVQTQDLVREERRAFDAERDKRVAEYGEKRITHFLVPLRNKLQQLKDGLSIINNPRSRPLIDQWEDVISPIRYVLYNGVKNFYMENAYMSNDMFQERIFKFFVQIESSWPTIDDQEDKYTIPWKQEMEEAIGKIDALIGLEIQFISTHIKKTYGYYYNVPISWDSLLPPKNSPK